MITSDSEAGCANALLCGRVEIICLFGVICLWKSKFSCCTCYPQRSLFDPHQCLPCPTPPHKCNPEATRIMVEIFLSILNWIVIWIFRFPLWSSLWYFTFHNFDSDAFNDAFRLFQIFAYFCINICLGFTTIHLFLGLGQLWRTSLQHDDTRVPKLVIAFISFHMHRTD